MVRKKKEAFPNKERSSRKIKIYCFSHFKKTDDHSQFVRYRLLTEQKVFFLNFDTFKIQRKKKK